MNKKQEWIFIAELARRIGRHYTRVHPKIKQAIERGEINTKNNKIDYQQAKDWWSAHTQTKHIPYRHRGKAGTSDSSSVNGIPDLRESQARKEAAIARIKELEAKEREGSVIDKAAAEKAFFKIGRQVRDILLAIPARLSGPLAVETDQRRIREVLEAEIMKGLREFQEMKV